MYKCEYAKIVNMFLLYSMFNICTFTLNILYLSSLNMLNEALLHFLLCGLRETEVMFLCY